MSDFRVPVVRVGTVTKHPGADTLSITEVDGCPVVFRTSDFKEGDLAVYVPVDAVVTKGKYAPLDFLPFKSNGTHRVRAVRLRGVFSMGLLVAVPNVKFSGDSKAIGCVVPAGAGVGQAALEGFDYGPLLGVTKYEEPEDLSTGTRSAKPPPDGTFMPVYDLESYRKYKHVFTPGEYVAVTEKVHGCNGRFLVDTDGRLHVGSHNRWVAEDERSVWWRAATAAQLQDKFQHPDVKGKLGFYGEVYGQVQDLKYGISSGVELAMFDVVDLKSRTFLSYPEFLSVCGTLGLKAVPCLGTFQHNEELIFPLAEGDSELARDHGGTNIREGVVVRPLIERQAETSSGLKRVCFKLHGQGYLLRKGGTEKH